MSFTTARPTLVEISREKQDTGSYGITTIHQATVSADVTPPAEKRTDSCAPSPKIEPSAPNTIPIPPPKDRTLFFPRPDDRSNAVEADHPPRLSYIIKSHYTAFKNHPLSNSQSSKAWTWKKAVVEVLSVRKAFPRVDNETAIIVMTAWFHVLCTVDDMIEVLDADRSRQALQKAISLLRSSCIWGIDEDEQNGPLTTCSRTSNCTESAATPSDVSTRRLSTRSRIGNGGIEIVLLIHAFILQCNSFLCDVDLSRVAQSVVTVWQFMLLELEERNGEYIPDSETYLSLRTRTIGLDPFFMILECLISPFDEAREGSMAIATSLKCLKASVGLAVGIQNDIVGLRKDVAEGERFNFILLMLEQHNAGSDILGSDDQYRNPNGRNYNEAKRAAFSKAVQLHNEAARSAMTSYLDLQAQVGSLSAGYLHLANCILEFITTHHRWATHSRRYEDPKSKGQERTMSRRAKLLAKAMALSGITLKARMM